MAAHADFDYLKQIACSSRDRRSLDGIAHRRERILRGSPDPDKTARRLAEQREEDYFSLRLDRETLVMHQELAAAAVDTYLEIFRDNAHRRHPAFLGTGKRRVVDLGANEGYYTLRIKGDNPGANVLAVEPFPPAFSLLERNIEANRLDGITAIQRAARGRAPSCGPGGQASPDTAILEGYPHVSSVSAFDLQTFPRPWIRSTHIRRWQVPAAPLSRLINDWTDEEIDLLKMDVEGAELEILEAAGEVLPRIAAMVIECHGRSLRRRCIDFLRARGFRCVFEEDKRSGDAYFLRP